MLQKPLTLYVRINSIVLFFTIFLTRGTGILAHGGGLMAIKALSCIYTTTLLCMLGILRVNVLHLFYASDNLYTLSSHLKRHTKFPNNIICILA